MIGCVEIPSPRFLPVALPALLPAISLLLFSQL